MRKNIETKFLALGTVNTISVFDFDDESVVKIAANRIHELHQRLSVFDENSDIAAVNRNAGKNFVKVHEDTLTLVQQAKEYAGLTGGAFDPTVRPFVTTWNISGAEHKIPQRIEIDKACAQTGYQDMMIDQQNCSLMLRRQNMALDLGSIAKGYACDEVRRILIKNGVTDAIINLGGTISVIGGSKTVGIQHPDQTTGVSMGKLTLTNQAAVTSGSYEKFFITNGKRYHHLIDPHTGYPADSGLKSLTLIGENALALDALSTAFFVLGAEKSSPIIYKLNLQAIFVTTDNQVIATNGLKDTFHLTL